VLVVDTSVAVKWVIPESGTGLEAGTDAALAMLPSALIAPDCIAAEFANALFKKVVAAEISEEQAIASIRILPDIVTMLPARALIEPAIKLAFDLRHPVHDCLFLALAMEQRAHLVTADAKFVKRCRASGQKWPVVLLGEPLP
jgi:predicted nucleic acid-binding protein